MRTFRFGVALRDAGDESEWVTACRRAEELGYDVIAVPDHLGEGRLAPFPALAMAAAVTERIRVVPFVLNVPFYNVGLLDREIDTVARLTGGRLDLGLGAGHMKSEFDDAGLPWWPARERIAYLERTTTELRRRLGDALPPLLIAGNSDGVLSLAAREADIVGFAGLRQVRGRAPGTFTLAGAEAMDERVAFVREHAGRRLGELEFNMLVQDVVVTDDPRPERERWKAAVPWLTLDADELADAPQLLFGTVDEIIEQVVARRERYGFSYVTVFASAMEAFAPVVRALAGR